MSVAGFLNPQWFRIASPPLTTYELPLKEMGDMAARLLLQRIDQGDAGQGHAPRAVRFEGRLVVRESTAAPRTEPLPQALRAGI
jgi:LacI family transcriptional regulator